MKIKKSVIKVKIIDKTLQLEISNNLENTFYFDFNKFYKSFESLLKLVIPDYDNFIQSQYKFCRNMPFPYPKYSEIELIESFQKLLDLKVSDHINFNASTGQKIINHFHMSIYHASKNKSISPYDAWYNDEILLKLLKNRMIYVSELTPSKIRDGFNIFTRARKVSVFSAAKAKMIINKYLSEYDEIFDPFSGFSGRMLGTISLNKRYVGQDISPIHVRESNKLIKFLQTHFEIPSTTVIIQDSRNTFGSYNSLFTCPPYKNKEKWIGVEDNNLNCDDWISLCLKKFKCKKYLFIVDDTAKYQNYIVESIPNKSGFCKNEEYVVVI